jgi:predicted TIM-barrel fold metal-dependent hydrolase
MTTYSQGRVVHDADSHVMETREWLEAFLAAEQAELGRGLLGKERGRLDALIDEARKRKHDAELDAQAAANPIAGTKGWGAYGAFDSDERSKVLDQFGFSRQLVFPTAGLRPVHESKVDADRYAAARAYNHAIAAFCAGDPRLVAVGYVPLDDPERVLPEAQHALEVGCGAILVSSGPAGERSPGHPAFDPFWALLSERKVPFMLHIGAGTQTQPKAFRNNGRPRAPDLHGGGENLRFCDYVMLWYAPQVFLTAMIYDGVFDRFPLLRGGVIESGAGWVPDFLRQLDLAYKSFSRTDPYLKQLPLMPSEYLRRAVRFTPFPGEDVGLMIKDAGPELFMFSTDYPHPEGTKDPLGRFERTMTDLDEPAKDKFYRGNFEEMMGMTHG